MRKAVAFCAVIEQDYKGQTHKVSSKLISEKFQAVIGEYQNQESNNQYLTCEAKHIDGSMNAFDREALISWLKADDANTCKILSNVRCLSEGVDIPALDAAIFLTPKNSYIDVIQSVGRVMRKSAGKSCGYIILPVVIPSGVRPEDALDKNENYKVVWQVLNALRSHDDKFNILINNLQYNNKPEGKLEHILVNEATKSHTIGETQLETGQLPFEFSSAEKALYAQIVKKCGDRVYWDTWSGDIANIVKTLITKINFILDDKSKQKEIKAFNKYLQILKNQVNDTISKDELIEMLAQHLITLPIFEAIFDKDIFNSNPISKHLTNLIENLHTNNTEKEQNTLNQFYKVIKNKLTGITTPAGKQKVILEVYDNFFKKAFPKMTQRLGIAYTPIELVDFVINSVDDILSSEFNTRLSDKDINILDPFTGTGTFIVRLIQSELIPKDKLLSKYSNELHANEIVLLAYYIASVNISSAFAQTYGQYKPFNGICFTDTFNSTQEKNLIDIELKENSQNIQKQSQLDIRVIIGNPPYSVGQKSENDNNQNAKYPDLDAKIKETYIATSKANNHNSLYDSYIRAIRWATDRIKDKGVIGFVINASFIESISADGLRKSLYQEFDCCYIVHLRGNIRKHDKKEGEGVFGQASQLPICLLFLVKNPARNKKDFKIYDIGDNLSKKEKLDKVKSLFSVARINSWQQIIPNQYNDWVKQRDTSFYNLIPLGDKDKSKKEKIFKEYSYGLTTGRDTWVYNFSKEKLINNIQKTINIYNNDLDKYVLLQDSKIKIEDIITLDKTKISWSRELKKYFNKKTNIEFKVDNIRISLYRPFTYEYLYFDKGLFEMQYQLPKIFPDENKKNLCIVITGKGAKHGFSVLMIDHIPDRGFFECGQCFPLYVYEKLDNNDNLFNQENNLNEYKKSYAITDYALKLFKDKYKIDISPEEIFYYIYGFLHSTDYRLKFKNTLNKQLARIGLVSSYDDFVKILQAGKDLGALHAGFEKVPMYNLCVIKYKDNIINDLNSIPDGEFYVEKMKFIDKDKTKIKYNQYITIENIPLEAYEYTINSKSAINWVIDKQSKRQDKDSKIINDANDFAIDTLNNQKYPLELLLRIINLSLKTLQIINNLPKVTF